MRADENNAKVPSMFQHSLSLSYTLLLPLLMLSLRRYLNIHNESRIRSESQGNGIEVIILVILLAAASFFFLG
jgi:hypothetical protein